MTTFIERLFSKRLVLCLAAGASVVLLLWPVERLRSENFVIYLSNQHKLIPVENIDGVTYLPLTPLLALKGQVSGAQEKRSSLKVRVGGTELQFHDNRSQVQVGKFTVTLPQPVLRYNGTWMAPASFISGVLSQVSGEPILYHPGSRRIFVGDVHPLSYSVHLQKLPTGARLEIQFTGPVAAQSAASNGKWLLFLGGAAIEPLESVIHFQDPYVKELAFDDQDGRPKLIITPGVEGLNFYPVLTPNRESLVADFRMPKGAALPQAAASNRGAAAAIAGHAAKPTAPPANASAAPVPQLPAIVLDAGHGGADPGARSRNGVLEKNLDAVIVEQVAAALDATHKYRIVFSRSGDNDPSIEQRTEIANVARPAAFLTFHAGDMGSHSPVVRVYTYAPPSPFVPSSSTPAPSSFVPWRLAQDGSEAKSRKLATALAQRFASIQGATAPAPVAAPVRQLRSIAGPAVAIEIGSLSPAQDAGALAQPAFQKQLAAAVAAAIAEFGGSPP
ncbi:MAG: N-acetylmuramoyl-L-alanine amidase [Terriglobia bacterium]